MKIALLTSMLIFLCMQGYAEDSKILSKINKAGENYYAAQKAADIEYRKDFSDAIAGASQIEIYLLLPQLPPGPSDSQTPEKPPLTADQLFEIPFRETSTILKRKKLSKEEISLLMPSLQRTIAALEINSGARCHDPVHGLRIWDGSEVIFQTTICYGCMNFYMTYPYEAQVLQSLNDPNFKTIMEQLMPIPVKSKK